MSKNVVGTGDKLADVPVESQLSLSTVTVIKLFAGVTLNFYPFAELNVSLKCLT